MAASQRARWAARRGEAAPEEAQAIQAEKPARRPGKTKQVSEAKLNALAKAREARWAKVRAAKRAGVQSETASATGAEKPKRKRNISEAGRRAMAL